MQNDTAAMEPTSRRSRRRRASRSEPAPAAAEQLDPDSDSSDDEDLINALVAASSRKPKRQSMPAVAKASPHFGASPKLQAPGSVRRTRAKPAPKSNAPSPGSSEPLPGQVIPEVAMALDTLSFAAGCNKVVALHALICFSGDCHQVLHFLCCQRF